LSTVLQITSGGDLREAHAGAAAAWIPDWRHSRFVGGLAWALIALLIVPEGFDYATLGTSMSPLSGGAVSRAIWLALLGSALVVIAWRSTLAWVCLRWLNPFLMLFVALAVSSVAWSIDPVVTLRRDLRLVTVLLDALAFMLVGWHQRRFQNVVRPILTIMLGGSLIFGLLFPTLAIHQETSYELVGAWRGLTNHKNSLGALSCIGVIFWTHAWVVKEVRLAAAAAGLAVCVACLLLSRSSTSLVTSVFVVLFLLLFLRGPRRLHRYMPYVIGLFAALLLVYSIAILRLVPGLDLLLQPIAFLTGKDLSFTGRSEIWAIITEHVDLHPYLGTGYGAYWVPLPGSPSAEFLQRLHFYPGSSHSGYMEVANDLGIAGLLTLIGYLLVYLVQCLVLLRQQRKQSALFLALLLQQGITNLSETHWLSVTSVNFAIMTLATAALARCLLDERLRLFFGAPHFVGTGTADRPQEAAIHDAGQAD
jgi:exopolysaccharide production protein ExoQ